MLVMRFWACLRHFITRSLSTILYLQSFSTLSSSSKDRLPSFTAFFICISSCKSSISLMQPFLCAGVSRTCWWYLGSLLLSGIGGRAKVQAGPIHSLPSQKSHLVPCFPSHSNFKYPIYFPLFLLWLSINCWNSDSNYILECIKFYPISFKTLNFMSSQALNFISC